jgi:hypothetical protein
MKTLLAVASAAFFVAPALGAATPIGGEPVEACTTWEMASADLTVFGHAYWRMPLDKTFGAKSDTLAAVFFYEAGGTLYFAAVYLDGCVSVPVPLANVDPLR